MTTISHHVTPIVLAQALDAVSSTALLPLGTRVVTNDGGEAVYVQASSGCAQYNAVVIGVSFVAQALSTGAAANGSGVGAEVGWCQTSLATAQYGWVQVSGRPIGKLASACADRVDLFTTATAGVLDDAVVSAGYVEAVYSKTTISNATAITLMVPSKAAITHYGSAA